jgi:hypothetical protein
MADYGPFTKAEWYSLPLKMRMDWWRLTEYGMGPPSSSTLLRYRHHLNPQPKEPWEEPGVLAKETVSWGALGRPTSFASDVPTWPESTNPNKRG